MKSDCFGGSFGDDLEKDANETYNFYIEMILHFQKLFDYKGSIQDILSLPYCLFQDLIVARVKERKEEQKNESQQLKKLGIDRDRLVNKEK